MKSCVIVFPLYQKPNKQELSFLENGIKLTHGFKQVIAAPEGLIIDESFGKLQELEVKRFAKFYFDDIKGYNQLMLSKNFYKTFNLFDYILVHQADVYLFKDELRYWCEKDFDYIGAPWFRPNYLNRSALFNWFQKIKLSFKKNQIYANRHNKVGNGGLSLRKISTFIKVLDLAKPNLLKKYTHTEHKEFNEDIFWSLEAPHILSTYHTPPLDEALRFAIEFNPEAAYKYNGKNLPFGCHAPLLHNANFWSNFIPGLIRD